MNYASLEPKINYFEHHIGDYDSATAHLSVVEDGIYSRLIRVYYRTEQPIPLDTKQVCRLVRAASKQEREIVASVLQEFFDKAPDGWHNTRCDEEIDRFRDKQEKAKRSAGVRWSAFHSQSERNANAQKTDDANAMRTQCEGNAPRARPQTPDTKHQTPDNPPKPPRKRGGAATQLVPIERLIAEGVTEMHARDWLAVRSKKGHPLTVTAWEGVRAEAAHASLSLDEAIKTAAENSWAGFKAKWLTEGSRSSSDDPYGLRTAL